MYNLVDLTNKKIIVTGASSGIGKAVAIVLSRLGANPILVARREDKLKEVASLLETNASVYPFDLSNLDGISDFIKQIVADNGPVDGLVHCAGIGTIRPLKMMKPSVIQSVMTINYYAFVELVRALSVKNCFNEGMSIVGISSVSSIQGNQAKTAYCASKAAMDASIRCLAKELAPKKIRLNSVAPALIRTELYEQFAQNVADSADAQSILQRQYMGVGEPEDVANAVAFLLSSASKYITGIMLLMDGGRCTS